MILMMMYHVDNRQAALMFVLGCESEIMNGTSSNRQTDGRTDIDRAENGHIYDRTQLLTEVWVRVEQM